ncbi:NAD(P)-binding protein [Coniochaeta ligniaria NRRL 30616]|uniref:NAD(P)-binding protein n=1 Tax=Coniochaeta ligniaria NRRL 30616 TaxID=1408157 RepID=A0A1J7J8V9_9PEZI|nr:NAD(P)-binding protein [Coniochaeta ligniaria NRRL 30616]
MVTSRKVHLLKEFAKVRQTGQSGRWGDDQSSGVMPHDRNNRQPSKQMTASIRGQEKTTLTLSSPRHNLITSSKPVHTAPSTAHTPNHPAHTLPPATMSSPTETTVVLITGANKGVGRATAQRLAREHNYTVIIASRSLPAGEAVASQLVAEGHRAVAVQLDVLSEESIAAAAQFVADTFGRLDVLVVNHGQFLDRWHPSNPELGTRELYTRTLAVNVVGAACVAEAFVPLLRKARGGPRVVFVSSAMASLANAGDKSLLYYGLNGAAYITSKTAVNMLALQYAKRFEEVGGKVNVACPGLVDTDLTMHSYAGAKTPEQGAEYIVKLATDAEEVRGRNGTFGSSEGDYPW